MWAFLYCVRTCILTFGKICITQLLILSRWPWFMLKVTLKVKRERSMNCTITEYIVHWCGFRFYIATNLSETTTVSEDYCNV